MTIDGLEVLEVQPAFAQDPELAASRFSTLVELSRARRVGFFPGQKPVHVFSHQYVLRGSVIGELEAFFNRRAGKWQSFLVPSWTAELGVNETNVTSSPSGAPDLFIDWCDYANNYGPADGMLGRYLFILFPGVFFASKVVGVTASTPGVVDQLELADNLPTSVSVSDPPVIGFLYHARFTDDELVMEYHGPSNAMTELGFIEVTVSTPEADV